MPASESLGGRGRAVPGPPQGPEGTSTHSAESTSSRPCGGTGGRRWSRRPRPARGPTRGARALEHGEALSPRYGCEPGAREPALASAWLSGLKPGPGIDPDQPFTHLPSLAWLQEAPAGGGLTGRKEQTVSRG